MRSEIHDNEIILATFNIASIHLALNTTQIQEAIILEKELVPWPASQEYVEGIMDLRGTIIPVINLKKRLNLPETDYGEDCRVAIVALSGITLGILFDSVKDVIRIPSTRIESLSTALQGDDRIITGVINHTETGRLIEILDPRRLVSVHPLEEFENRSVEEIKGQVVTRSEEKQIRLVIFAQGGQEYGVGIDAVREVEVVDSVDDTFSSALIRGSVTVHGSQLPLVHLHSLKGSDAVDSNPQKEEAPLPWNVIILTVDDATFAVAIDGIKEMITISERDVIKLSMDEDAFAMGVVQLADGRNIIMLDPAVVFREHIRDVQSMNKIFKRDSIAEFSAREAKRSRVVDSTGQNYLFFEVNRLFALELKHIQEILSPSEVILPPTPYDHLEGILNLRQRLLPQFNLRSFLGFDALATDNSDNRKVIVLQSNEHAVALVVDRILNLGASTKETDVPTLSRELNDKRELFKSLIVSKNEAGESRHALHIDSGMLIHELIRFQSNHSMTEVQHA